MQLWRKTIAIRHKGHACIPDEFVETDISQFIYTHTN